MENQRKRGGGCLNGLALCAGYGGLELGIEQVFDEYKTVCYVEGEAFAAQHLRKKMEEGRLDEAPIWSNVKSFNGESWRGKVDIISGGFPCQPYSTAGKQMGKDDPRDLWPDFVRIIGEVRPGFLFFENVPNVVKLRLNQIILDLDKLGYSCSWGTLAASQVRARHKRNRWFLFGVCNTNNNGLLEYANEESRQGFTKKRELESHRFENLCKIDSNAKRFGFNENKQSSPRGKLDFEGFSRVIPHPDNSSKCFNQKAIFENNRHNVGGICENVSNTNNGRRKIQIEGRKPGIKMFSSISQEGRIDQWGGSFNSIWEVEPSMGRLVDGSSDWVDKLRLLGNGVVPQQAAYALQILGERLAWGMVENRTPKD